MFGLSTRVIHKGLRASGSGFNVNLLTSPARFRQSCETSLWYPACQLGNASVDQILHVFTNYCAFHPCLLPVSVKLVTNSIKHGWTPTIRQNINFHEKTFEDVRGCSRAGPRCSWTFVDVRGRAWTFAERVADVRGRSRDLPKLAWQLPMRACQPNVTKLIGDHPNEAEKWKL